MTSFLKTLALLLTAHSAFALTPGDYQKELKCIQGLSLLNLDAFQNAGVEGFYDKTTGLLAMPTIERSNKFYIVAPNGAAQVQLTRSLPANLTFDNVQTYGIRIGLPGKPKVIIGYNADKRFNDTSHDNIVWQHGTISDALRPYIVEMPLLDVSPESVRKALLWRYKDYVSNVYRIYQHERRASFVRDAEAYRQIFGFNPDPSWAEDPAQPYIKALELCGAVPGLEQPVREELAKFDTRPTSPVSLRRNKSPVKRSIATVPEDSSSFGRRPAGSQPAH